MKIKLVKMKNGFASNFIQMSPFRVNLKIGETIDVEAKVAYQLLGDYSDMFTLVEEAKKEVKEVVKKKDIKEYSTKEL